jgi:metallo-beta-lactamase class B
VPQPSPTASRPPLIPPTRVFDNLYYVGDEFVGAWLIQSDQGLIMIDAFTSNIDAQRYASIDMRQLGLDAKQIRYVVVTHGHWDHYGGASYFQKLGARIVMGMADWDTMPARDPFGAELQGFLAPKPDVALADATMDLTLGNTTVKLFRTPGHTPGTISALIPAREGTTTHWLALWGGNAFLRNVDPHTRNGVFFDEGLRRMYESAHAFSDWIGKNGGVGLISTHMTGERETRLAALKQRAPGSPHPFVMGKERTQDYFAALGHCLQARMIEVAQRSRK